MTLLWLLLILVFGGLVAWRAGQFSEDAPRWIALGALTADLVLGLLLWRETLSEMPGTRAGTWIQEIDWLWIPSFGIRFHLAADGLSLLLILLTFLLGLTSVWCSWNEIVEQVGLFHLNLLWTLAGIVGVFLAVDLFLFYFFWELMLVPMYFLISIWGHENRTYAALKFFLFTQAGGLLMLISILVLSVSHWRVSGSWTFDYVSLLNSGLHPSTAWWLMLGFFAAFAVKLPVVPLHTWLPDAHTEAPTAGSVILAGLLLKTGGYGLLRFAVPLFPDAARSFAPAAMTLAVVGILYGAVLAFAQNDLKRMIAYTSVSHLGFVLLGVFAGNVLALRGAVLQMICHGLSTGALFILAGALQERAQTRDLRRLGGLWSTAPRFGALMIFFSMASLGLPGLGNFVAEILVLFGSFGAHPGLTILATAGLVGATLYALTLVQRSVHGPNTRGWRLPDLRPREMSLLAIPAVLLLWLGLYPQPVLETARPAFEVSWEDGAPQTAPPSASVQPRPFSEGSGN